MVLYTVYTVVIHVGGERLRVFETVSAGERRRAAFLVVTCCAHRVDCGGRVDDTLAAGVSVVGRTRDRRWRCVGKAAGCPCVLCTFLSRDALRAKEE